MITLKWIIGLICLLYPTPVEGNSCDDSAAKVASADQKTCDSVQALPHEHAT